MDMRRRMWCLLGLGWALAAGSGLAGCGATGASTHGGTGIAQGRATLTIVWPARSRLIPDASNSIVILVKRGSSAVAQQIVPRPPGSSSTVTFDPLPTGDLSATATAFPNVDGSGIAQATATVPLTVQANQTTHFTVTMNSTIVSVEVSAPQSGIVAGGQMQMAAAARDASGAVVLLSPAKLSWQSSNPAAATVDSGGRVSGIAAGNADISATDTESGVSGRMTIQVRAVGTISFQAPLLFNIASPNQVVPADFDGDGKIDIAVGSSTAVSIFWGHGDGTFDPPQTIQSWSGGVSVWSAADMNGDGRPDLVCGVPSQFIVLHNLGGRSFAFPIAVPLNTQIGQIVTADFTGDGVPDVAVVAYDHPGSTSTDIFIFKNLGGVNYTQLPTVSNIWIILGLTAGDLNGDGKVDLLASITTDIVGESGAGVYWGDGNGHFTGGPGVGTASFNTLHTAIADFNGDGKADYVLANDTDGSLSVVMNAGNNTFATPANYGPVDHPDTLLAPDLDGDGRPDIVAENRGSSITVLRNQNGLFPSLVQFPTGGGCGPIATADFNGDGKPDIVASLPDANAIAILLNNTR